MPVDDQAQPENDQPHGEGDPAEKGGLTLNLNFSFGQHPPADSPDVKRLIEEAQGRAAASPDGTGAATQSHEVFSLDFRDGTLRVGGRAPGYERPPDTREPSPSAGFDRLDEFGARTAEVRRWLNWFILLLAAAVPLALLAAGVATGQGSETVIWMVIFGLVMGGMITQIRR